MKRKMSKKLKFSVEEEEKIIDFVKNNEILYNAKHKQFRETERKNFLWLQLAKDLKMDVDTVKKKWIVMRDYYVRMKDKKTTGSAALTSKRDKSLSFLIQTSTSKRSTLPSLLSDSSQTEGERTNKTESRTADEFPEEINEMDGSVASVESAIPPGSFSGATASKNQKIPQRNEILREFLAQRPKPYDFMPHQSADNIQLFFDAMASTVRKLSPLSIARIKLKVTQIVGEEEIAWAENAEEEMKKWMGS